MWDDKNFVQGIVRPLYQKVIFSGSLLGANLDWSPVWNQAPDFLNFPIGYGYATGRPIVQILLASQPLELSTKAVNHDVAAGVHAPLTGPLYIALVRIGDVQSQMKSTRRIAEINPIEPLRSPIVTLPPLGRQATAAKRYRIGFYDLVSAEQ
jgi:hypothetical protein